MEPSVKSKSFNFNFVTLYRMSITPAYLNLLPDFTILLFFIKI